MHQGMEPPASQQMGREGSNFSFDKCDAREEKERGIENMYLYSISTVQLQNTTTQHW